MNENKTASNVTASPIERARPRLRSAVRAGEMGAVSQATYSQSSVRGCENYGLDGSWMRMGSEAANAGY